MHDSWVFPLLIEDNIACALSPLEYLIPLWPQPTAAMPIRPAAQTTSAVPNTDYDVSPSPRVESLPLRQSSRTTREPKRFSDQDWSM